MGQQLSSFYDQAKDMGGMKAQMRLAILTGVPSTKASDTEDTSDNVGKFQSAMQELEKEFKN